MNPESTTIGFFARKDPFTDRSEWSGTIYHLCQAIISRGFRVRWIPYGPDKWAWRRLNISKRILYGLHTKVRQLDEYAILCARSVDRSLLQGCDCLFFPGGGEMIRHLHTSIPSIYLVDATYRLMRDYYYRPQAASIDADAERRAGGAYATASRIIAASNWAKRSLVNDYGIDPRRVSVFEFGANIDDSDIVVRRRQWSPGDEIQILFSGVDWERKGGEVAVEAVHLLREKGYNARLAIAGIRKLPARYASLPFIRNAGFLSKSDLEQSSRYIQMFDSSHLFLLPTRAECGGIVFSEAAAFGMPSITYDTGGVSDYVVDGVSGYRLPLSAGPAEFADRIASVLSDGSLSALSEGARELYLSRLNWHTWGECFEQLFASL